MSSRSWNRVELMGNLTRDPELRYTPNGAAVCTFGLATNRSYVVDGERREDVDFHNLVAWNKLAELCNQLLKKGTKVFVSGRLQYREWEGQDGQKRRVAEIVTEDMIVLTSRNGLGNEYSDSEPAETIASDSASKASEKSSSKAKETASAQQAAPAAATDTPSSDTNATETGSETVDDNDLPF